MVALVCNCGYMGFYQIMMDKIGLIKETSSICRDFIVKHDQVRKRGKVRKAMAKYKRVRKFAIEAMKREFMLE